MMFKYQAFLALCALFIISIHAAHSVSKGHARRAAAMIDAPRLLELEIYTSDVGYEMNTMMYDRSDASNATHGCEYKGPLNGMVNNQACFFHSGNQTIDNSFTWAIENFTCANDFTLRFEHTFIDPAVGPCAQSPDGSAIFCATHTWSYAMLTPEVLTCSHDITVDLPGGYHGCHLTKSGLDAILYRIVS